MKKKFTLEGLDCAHCASEMERAISKIDGVNEVTLNFMTTKLTIDADKENMDNIVEEAKKVIKKLEPDVIIKKS